MEVLVACEESQVVCKAFRERGHAAFSCDLQECSGGHPEWHFKMDVNLLLRRHNWDMIIAHPPCTYLTSASASRLFNADHTLKDFERYKRGAAAAIFFMTIFETDCPRIAVENPTPLKCFGLPKYTQMIEPYQFGDPWHKRTCLWLKGLPRLEPTDIVEPTGFWVGNNSNGGFRNQKVRSRSFDGIARAMAEQWG